MATALEPSQLGWLIDAIKVVNGWLPMVPTLVYLMGLDIISGVILAFSKRTLNSTTSTTGICRKAMTILLVAMGIALEPLCNGLPVSTLIALGYVKGEVLSIMENASALGLPLPAIISEVLAKIQ